MLMLMGLLDIAYQYTTEMLQGAIQGRSARFDHRRFERS